MPSIKKIHRMANHSAQILKQKKHLLKAWLFPYMFFSKLEKKEERSEDKGSHPGKYVN